MILKVQRLSSCIINKSSILTISHLGILRHLIRHYSSYNDSDIKILNELQKKIQPYSNFAEIKLKELSKKVKCYSSQIKHHLDKAKTSLHTANVKLLEQEKKQRNKILEYNDDVETEGRIKDLPSERERNRHKWSRKLGFYLDSLQETIFTATKALNDVTGYSSIERLKKSIDVLEIKLKDAKQNVARLREAYSHAVSIRNQSQKHVNELLQRKHIWSPEDLDKFTKLYTKDTENAKAEEDAKSELKVWEAQEEEISNLLYRAILTRYHEEQIWSDKIRRTSTWGTFILMGVNIFLFLIVQLFLEPWKRSRLTNSFENKVKAALDEHLSKQNLKLDKMNSQFSSKNFPLKESQPAKTSFEAKYSLDNPSTINFVPISFNSFSEFKHTTSTNFYNMRIWLTNLLRKLVSLNYTVHEDQFSLNMAEFNVYSGLLLAFGVLLGGWIA